MLNLKKTAVAVLALGSSAVFAGTMGPVCTPGSVTVPCERSAWDFGVQALYLQEVGRDYLDFDRFHFVDVDPERRGHNFDKNNNWGWGFKLEGSYHFNTGNDININWYHLDYKDNHSRDFGFETVDPVRLLEFTETVKFNPKWDAVNFEFGQHVDFGEQKNIRFHAGAQYVNASRQLGFSNNLETNDIINVDLASFSARQKFSGFGPRVGSDMTYDLSNGFAIYGNAAAAVFAGTNNFNLYFDNFDVVNTRSSKTIVVPELEAKLGAKYTYAMPQGDLTLDVGYMWVDYINALYNPITRVRTDFALDGVYFGAKWVGNVA